MITAGTAPSPGPAPAAPGDGLAELLTDVARPLDRSGVGVPTGGSVGRDG
jgi:hypothetical protein